MFEIISGLYSIREAGIVLIPACLVYDKMQSDRQLPAKACTSLPDWDYTDFSHIPCPRESYSKTIRSKMPVCPFSFLYE